MSIPSSYNAWQEVCKQINDNGGEFGKPVFSHPIIEQAVKALGWRNLRMSENPTADRARFIEAFEQLAGRAEKESMLIPEVRGFIEGQKVNALPAGEMQALSKKLSLKG
jgi:hypothetical protein